MVLRLALTALALALALAPPALAQDPRLVERVYDPGTVVRLEGRVNVQSTIRFGDGETIENVAIGDSQSWQVTPNRRANLLFVKPLAPRAATNMTVVTNRHTYLFDLVAGPAVRNPVYILSFIYPEPSPEERAALAAAQAEAAGAPSNGLMVDPLEFAAANDDLAVLDPARLNFAWRSDGVVALLPERVFDNGFATFLAWHPDAALPAILVRDHTGTEGPVNFAVRGDTIVIEGVPGEIILRSGNDMARLVNERPGAALQGG